MSLPIHTFMQLFRIDIWMFCLQSSPALSVHLSLSKTSVVMFLWIKTWRESHEKNHKDIIWFNWHNLTLLNNTTVCNYHFPSHELKEKHATTFSFTKTESYLKKTKKNCTKQGTNFLERIGNGMSWKNLPVAPKKISDWWKLQKWTWDNSNIQPYSQIEPLLTAHRNSSQTLYSHLPTPQQPHCSP